jgi:hypothetical protein
MILIIVSNVPVMKSRISRNKYKDIDVTSVCVCMWCVCVSVYPWKCIKGAEDGAWGKVVKHLPNPVFKPKHCKKAKQSNKKRNRHQRLGNKTDLVLRSE